MNDTIFPDQYEAKMNLEANEYETQIRNNAEKKIEEERKRSGWRIHAINQKRTCETVDIEAWTKGATLIGLGVGFVVFCACCIFSFILGLFAWAIVAGLGALCGYFTAKKIDNNYTRNVMLCATEEREERKKTADAERKIRVETEHLIHERRQEVKKNVSDYKLQFENNVKKVSTQFVDSTVAKEISDWITEGFAKTIKTADRSSHIFKISIPFQIKVFTNEIVCNIGTYDFNVHRCEYLNNSIEQAALTRVIASMVQFDIAMLFPKDVSGTDVTININYSYNDGSNSLLNRFSNGTSAFGYGKYVLANIEYIAPNGYYQEKRSW